MLIKLQLKTSDKINLYLWTLRAILKNKINSYSHINKCINYKITTRDITIPKGAFAHKKTKEQVKLSYRKVDIHISIPLIYSHLLFSQKGCLSFLKYCQLPVDKAVAVKSITTFQ